MKKRPVGALRALIREYASIGRINENIFDDFVKFITPTIGSTGYVEPSIGQKIAEPVIKRAQDAVMTLTGATAAASNVLVFLLVAIPASLISSRVARDEAAFEPKILGSKMSLKYSGDPHFVVVGENPYDGKLLIIEYSGTALGKNDYPDTFVPLVPNDDFSSKFAKMGNQLRDWNFTNSIIAPFSRGYDITKSRDPSDPIRDSVNGKMFYLVDYSDVGIAPRLKGAISPEFGVSGLFLPDPNKKTPSEAQAAALQRPTPLANAKVGTFECELEPDEALDYIIDNFDEPQGAEFMLGIRCSYQYANSPSVGITAAVIGAAVGAASTKTWQGAGLGAIIGGLTTDAILRFPVMCWAVANEKYEFAAANLFLIGAQIVSAGTYKFAPLSASTKGAVIDLSMQIFAGLLPDYILQRDQKIIEAQMERLSKNPGQIKSLLSVSEQEMLDILGSRYSDI